MKKQEYAVVDIETTGGNASHSRITETESHFIIYNSNKNASYLIAKFIKTVIVNVL